MRRLYRFSFYTFPSIWNSYVSGLIYSLSTVKIEGRGKPFLKHFLTWDIVGRPKICRNGFLQKRLLHLKDGELIIGKNFCCRNKLASNSVGIFQRCFINISHPGSKIVIGDNVGISGTTLTARKEIVIGNDVNIGSGCLITDSDAHSIRWQDRLSGDKNVKAAPVHICDKVFIGARSIILKGVTIGEGSVIGAGSVVTKDIPANEIWAGNPARFVKKLD